MELPPQPKPEDFFLDGSFRLFAYEKALQSWEKVCSKLAKRNRATLCGACGEYHTGEECSNGEEE
jgi:hypothetical protein